MSDRRTRAEPATGASGASAAEQDSAAERDRAAEHDHATLDLERVAEAIATLGSLAHRQQQANEIAELTREHFGTDPAELPIATELLPTVERPNLQLALDDLTSSQADARVVGFPDEVAHFGGFSIAALLSGRFRGPCDIVPPTRVDHPVDIDRSLSCVSSGIWLLRYDDEPVVIALAPTERHGPPEELQPRVSVVAHTEERCRGVLQELQRLRSVHNVYRGKMLGFSFSRYGDFGVEFMKRPTTSADEVVLPAETLDAIVRHSIGMGARADELRDAGLHVRRGLLLHGPPGTGKTHTIGMLCAAMPERTVVVLQGPSVGALGQAAAIVRSLTPSMLVIEDVDLIASERGMPGIDTNPLLFQLLNEMDGLQETDDVQFVLTTNRVEVLEPALVARPGRIDQAVAIDLPDAAARERLLRLHLDQTTIDDLSPIVEATEGRTASYLKELGTPGDVQLDRGPWAPHDRPSVSPRSQRGARASFGRHHDRRWRPR